MQKKLIIQIARFGDIVQLRRLVESLIYEDISNCQSKNEISLCVDKSQEKVAKLLYPHLEVIGIHAFDSDQSTLLTENKKIFSYILSQNFDEVYTLNYTPLSYALARLFDAEKVRGYKFYHGQESKSAWHEIAFKHLPDRSLSPLHVSDYWAFLADNPIDPHKVNPSAYEKMCAWQAGKGSFEVGLILSGQNARRSVPAKDFALIVHVLASRFDKVHFNLLGTEKEESLAREFFSHLPKASSELVTNRVGKTSFEDLLSIIKNSDLVLSPDTGSLHAAAFYGVPTLSFFCSSAFCYETGAYGLGHICVQSTFPCAPCLEAKECHHKEDIFCHKQFSSPALLAKLANTKTKKPMEYFAFLESSFDEVGLNYSFIAGEEKQREKSNILRKLLFEYRYGKPSLIHSQEVEEMAAQLYDGPFTFFIKNKV